jgi:hypothetical protein
LVAFQENNVGLYLHEQRKQQFLLAKTQATVAKAVLTLVPWDINKTGINNISSYAAQGANVRTVCSIFANGYSVYSVFSVFSVLSA